MVICVPNNEPMEVFMISAFGDNLLYRIMYANVLYFIVMHGGPLTSLAFLNYKLIQALKKRQRRREEMGKVVNGGYQHDITLVLVVVICVFMFCQTPTFIDHILWTAVNKEQRKCGQWHYYYTAIADILAIFNSSVNFLIYIITSRKFRQLLLTSCATPGLHVVHIQPQLQGIEGNATHQNPQLLGNTHMDDIDNQANTKDENQEQTTLVPIEMAMP